MPDWPSGWFSTLQHRRIAAAGIASMLLLAFTVFRPPSTPGPLERDFEAYYAAGAAANSGADPYSRAIWSTEIRVPGVDRSRDELLPFVGPAAALPFWSLLARLPYVAALGVWTAILATAVLVVLMSALKVARAPRDPLFAILAISFTIASAPVIGALALGQAALVAAAGVAAAVAAYRARSLPIAFAGTLVAALQPNLAFPLLARIRSRWDVAVAASAACVFAFLTLAAGGGVDGFRSYLNHLSAHASAERFIAIQYTPAAIASNFGIPPPEATFLGTSVALAATAATVILVVRERLDATTATLLACAALPLAVPFFHEHDFVLELLPILVLAIRARGRARGLASIAAVLILTDWFGLAQRHFAQGQIVCLGLAVAFGFIGLGEHPPRRARSAYAGLQAAVVLSALFVPLGIAHPAPTWPDNLPAAFHADRAGDASTVWAQEQRAAGLATADPIWGVLRAVPLAGCVVLAAALVGDARRRRATRRPDRTRAPERSPIAVY